MNKTNEELVNMLNEQLGEVTDMIYEKIADKIELKELLNMLNEQLGETTNMLYEQIADNIELKELGDKYMEEIVELKEIVGKTEKIGRYYNKKERPLRRKDFNNEDIIERYVNGESAYSISKETGVGQMTIISRLKRAGVYKGNQRTV